MGAAWRVDDGMPNELYQRGECVLPRGVCGLDTVGGERSGNGSSSTRRCNVDAEKRGTKGAQGWRTAGVRVHWAAPACPEAASAQGCQDLRPRMPRRKNCWSRRRSCWLTIL